VHPTAGACMVGARKFLIAYNVDLATTDRAVAAAIARKIRESSGGFPHVKAMGLYLESRGCAQVSMNLTDFENTPLEQLYRTMQQEAQARGTRVASCELIGFVPRKAVEQAPQFFERAPNFSPSRIIENRLGQLLKSSC
jgi:glutamate formiminotransferase